MKEVPFIDCYCNGCRIKIGYCSASESKGVDKCNKGAQTYEEAKAISPLKLFGPKREGVKEILKKEVLEKVKKKITYFCEICGHNHKTDSKIGKEHTNPPFPF